LIVDERICQAYWKILSKVSCYFQGELFVLSKKGFAWGDRGEESL